jgi:hypothetical protein
VARIEVAIHRDSKDCTARRAQVAPLFLLYQPGNGLVYDVEGEFAVLRPILEYILHFPFVSGQM